ncbi:hypothetical protein J8273_4712 [Carpediemonas membranifera]|uniref:Uncharacterized protein n=1 Tax=Carpediemonas membranifera TaxID=201153 RepID=A0A8J6DZM6_9EUKA|nr:hypothetical protein J8273_4712 [Carpediemonas membranifera]|eukprot:KAG9393849.1 hypothetical protein J8273_4712 [Carpediemonas membranifera]
MNHRSKGGTAKTKGAISSSIRFARDFETRPKPMLSGAPRFSETKSFAPSPADYSPPRSALNTESVSYSYRGFGPMASKSTGHSIPRTARHRAGPTSYSPKLPEGTKMKVSTAAFGKTVGYKVPRAPSPGPGQYSVPAPFARTAPAPSMSHAPRFAGPKFEVKANDTGGIAESFDRSERGLNEDPLTYYTGRAALNSRAQSSKERLGKNNRLPKLNPNATLTQRQVDLVDPFIADTKLLAYSERQREIHKRILSDNNAQADFKPAPESRVFKVGNLDRFGRPIRNMARKDSMPGPGQYASDAAATVPKAVSSAAFVSGSRRFEYKPKGVPGPAFYAPGGHGGKKSYHIRMGLWI